MKTETIQAKIEKIRYCKKDTQWFILSTSRGAALGTIPFEVKEGDNLNLTGHFQTSKFDGKQEFIFKIATLSIPEDPRSLLKYAVELTKGLGKSAEEKIWARYGANWQTATLAEIPKISESAKFNWLGTLERLKEQAAQTQAIAFLLSKGTTLNMASAAWGTWREKTITTVMANCYELAELPHYGFRFVDETIRPQFNIQDEDPRRIEAALLYIMNQLTDTNGSLIAPADINAQIAVLIPNATKEKLNAGMAALQDKKKIKILDSKYCALWAHWWNDNLIFTELGK